jgi:hypothetical protein
MIKEPPALRGTGGAVGLAGFERVFFQFSEGFLFVIAAWERGVSR